MPRQPKTDARALDKVLDATLREQVAAGAEDPVSVILEVDLPPQQISVQSRQERLSGQGALLRGVIAESPAQQQENADRIAQTGDYITQVVGTTPHWLAAARAFTFKATPVQLRKIAAYDFTRAVRPNRKLSR